MEFCMFELVLSTKFQLKTDNFEFLDQIYPKKGISSWKQNKQSNDYKRLLFV